MKSIKTKLIISFTILILSVTVIIGMISLQVGYNSLKEEAEYSLQKLSAEGAKLVENRMEALLSTLRMVAMNEELQEMGWEVDVSILEQELKKTNFIDIGLVLPNGYTHFTDGTVRLMSDREYVSHALEGKEEISDVIISRVSRKPEIEAAVPIILNGNIVGALVGRMEADALSEITKDIGYGEKGYSYMINASGTMIAHPNSEFVIKKFNPISAAENDSGLEGIAKAFEKIQEEKTGVTSFTYEKSNLFAGFAPIKGTEWSFVITADEDEIMSAIPRMFRSILFAMAVVFPCSLGIVFFLDNALTRPLVARAGEAGKGFAVVAEEIKKLADQSANSTKHIDATITDLHEKMKQAVEGMDRISLSSKRQQNSVEDTIQKYKDIAEAMRKSEAAVEELNKSEKDMQLVKIEIVNLLTALSTIAGQNAASTQQAATTMQEQTAAVHVVAEVSDRLTDLAKKLRGTIIRFKI